MPQLFVILAALSWGFISLFVKKLTIYGFTEMEIVTIRVLYAFILLIPVVIFQQKKGILRIKLIHLPYFFGTGLFSIVFFNWCYFTAMNKLSVSLAVMLLYTSPVFVVLLSYFILKEKLTKKKLIAVSVTIIGCSMIALAGSGGGSQWNQTGFIIGLGAGLGYALYSIFGKLALRYYNSTTITFYTFFIASLCLVPFYRFWEKMSQLPIDAHVYMIGLALIPTVLAYILYTIGLNRVESSTAAILATIEPAAAIFVGILLFKEKLFFLQFIGILFILSSVLILSLKRKTADVSLSAPREL
ncbi:DMT family transporter [Heyndrickxia sp. NPDC080065]|uniref:DMT family transporter n=1 Tax=Heyndrickxia sp. NPDC080065 TaxID=3390568 RepID=UPI003D04D980